MRFPAIAALLVPALAVAAPKAHQMTETKGAGTGPTTKTVSQCGVKILPLSVGNQWTYSMVPAPLPPDDQIKRIAPAQPNTIVITVKSIDAKKCADTVITLEEKSTTDLTKDPKKPVLDERTVTTTITCNAKKFEISPDSFFFAGEPGGYDGMKIDTIERVKGTSLALVNGGIGETVWREDIVAKWTRVPHEGVDVKPANGKLELERQFTPQQPEPIATKAGTYKAEKIGLVTTGRVTLDGAAADTKPLELPAAWVSTLWLAEGAGVVQTLNPYQHMYQLASATLK